MIENQKETPQEKPKSTPVVIMLHSTTYNRWSLVYWKRMCYVRLWLWRQLWGLIWVFLGFFLGCFLLIFYHIAAINEIKNTAHAPKTVSQQLFWKKIFYALKNPWYLNWIGMWASSERMTQNYLGTKSNKRTLGTGAALIHSQHKPKSPHKYARSSYVY